MEQVIYADVLIFLNTVITFILLLTVKQFSGAETGAGRLILGSAVGGLYSLILLAPQMNFFLTLLTKTAIAVTITCISFKVTTFKKLFRSLLLFLGASFLYAGVMYTLSYVPGTGFLTVNNGYGYVNLSMTSLIFISVVLYGVISILKKRFFLPKEEDMIYDFTLTFRGREVSGKALLDSGNNVRDVYSEREVLIVSANLIEELTGMEVKNDVAEMTAQGLSVRLLPVKSLSSHKLLPAFTAEKAVVYDDGIRKEVKNPCVAVTQDILGGEKYRALIGNKFFERSDIACLQK